MASMKITFQSRSLVQAAKLQQQVIAQMKPLGYEFETIQSLPISNCTFETTMTLVYKKKEAKKEEETP